MNPDKRETLAPCLEKLGLSSYQARVFSSLVSLGPSSVADIQRSSGVPRTKIYEILGGLSSIGAIQYKTGRPMIYDALQPSVLIEQLRNSYLRAADEATRLLKEAQNLAKNSAEGDDLVWTVRGKMAVRRKAASILESAKKNILMIESYPPKLIQATGSILKSCAQRKLVIRVFCILDEGQGLSDEAGSGNFVQFRRVSRMVKKDPSGLTEQLLIPIQNFLSRDYCIIIVDDSESFVSFPDRKDDAKNLGVTLRVPGLPYVQRVLFERIVRNATSKNVR